jgi:hypothetical protein
MVGNLINKMVGWFAVPGLFPKHVRVVALTYFGKSPGTNAHDCTKVSSTIPPGQEQNLSHLFGPGTPVLVPDHKQTNTHIVMGTPAD